MQLVLTWLAGLAGALGLLTGALLLAMPGRLLRDTPHLLHRLFAADVLSILNTRRTIEKPIYRHHRLFGVAMIGAAAIWMWLLYRLDAHYHLVPLAQRWLGTPGAYAIVLACWILAFSALAIGLFLLIRPSAIKPFESVANRWIEPLPPRKPSATGTLPRLVLQAPRLAGLLLLAAGIACLLAITR